MDIKGKFNKLAKYSMIDTAVMVGVAVAVPGLFEAFHGFVGGSAGVVRDAVGLSAGGGADLAGMAFE